MLPVSVLPVAGILLGVGSAKFTWLPPVVSNVMAQSGGAIFGNLPLIFAIGVALGLTGNDGVAALAAVVGYAVHAGDDGRHGPAARLRAEDRSWASRRSRPASSAASSSARSPAIAVQPLLPDPAAAVSRVLRRQALGADPDGVRGRSSPASCSASSGRRSAGRSITSRAGRRREPGARVRALRRRRALADSVRPASHLERAVLLRGRPVRRPGDRQGHPRRDLPLHGRRSDRRATWPAATCSRCGACPRPRSRSGAPRGRRTARRSAAS